jgi:hypothetical protein
VFNLRQFSVAAIILATSISSLGAPVTLPQIKNENCTLVFENLNSKNSNLDKLILSSQSILDGKPTADIPISALFQANINDPVSVSARTKTLSGELTKEQISISDEFKAFVSCAKEAKQKQFLDQVIAKQIELNFNRLSFLKLDKDKRDLLLSSYEALRQQSAEKYKIEKQLSESKALKDKAQSNLLEQEKVSTADLSLAHEKILGAQSEIEKHLVNIEAEHIDFIQNIIDEKVVLDELRLELSSLTDSGTVNKAEDINSHYLTADKIWRKAGQKLLETFSRVSVNSNFTPPSLSMPQSFANDEEKQVYDKYLNEL